MNRESGARIDCRRGLLVFERAQNPREDHQNAHFDEAITAVVDRYGTEPVRNVIHRVLVEHYPFCTATGDLAMRNINGVRIGTTAGWFLKEHLGPDERDHQAYYGYGLVVDPLAALPRFRVELGHLEGTLHRCVRCSSGGPATYWTRNLDKHLVD